MVDIVCLDRQCPPQFTRKYNEDHHKLRQHFRKLQIMYGKFLYEQGSNTLLKTKLSYIETCTTVQL